jgi:cation diffusion facilitator family transporter
VRITRIGLFVNLGMAIGKGLGGYIFHSQALIADGFHALTDLVSDFMTLATISWSLKPPTERFPSGYGKIESLGALGVSSLLLFGGVGMGLNGLDTLYTQFFVDAAHHAGEHSHGLFGFLGHSHSHGHSIPDLNAAWLAGGSIVVKEWLYRASKDSFFAQARHC